jgi:murein DD-endopeptidase MepM/ murein hydrolase activator NlpD
MTKPTDHLTRPQILAEKVFKSGRRRGWALLAAIPLFGVAAAFGIAPDTETRPLELRSVIESIQLPVPQAIDDGQYFVREERVVRGDTVSAMLERLDIRDQDAIAFIRNDRAMRPLHQLAPGRAVRAKTDLDGDLHWLEYATGQGTVLRLERGEGERFSASERPLELERRIEMKSGEIRSSLFAATDAANLPDAIATQMAEMFSSDIDFHRDLRRGDTFTVVYESFHHQGERVRVGRVIAAEFLNGRRVLQGVWFETEPGQGGYYTPGGLSLRRAFLRSPLEFSRITSGFSNARYHPILQEMRAHRGIDYAAPIGTPIKAVANGTVDFVGRQSGYGNLVILAHANGVTTVYGHMNSFASSMRKGARVNQGDVIGTVGMTGLATGPHLHFEFRISGVHMDPLKVAMPEALPITNALRPAFEQTTAQYSEQLRILRGSNLARLE